MFYLYNWNVHFVKVDFQLPQSQIADFQGIAGVKTGDNPLTNTFTKCSKSMIWKSCNILWAT